MPKWAARYRSTGSVAPGRIGGHRPWLLEPYRERVHALVAATSVRKGGGLVVGWARTRRVLLFSPAILVLPSPTIW